MWAFTIGNLVIFLGLVSAYPRPHQSPRTVPEHSKGLNTIEQFIEAAQSNEDAKGKATIFANEDNDEIILVEMDMKMKQSYYNYLHGRGTDHETWKGLRDKKFRWTDNTIPYIITDVFSESQKAMIRKGMDEWERFTCLKFVPRQDDKNYVNIISANGCWSMVGMNGGKQDLSLQINSCLYHHTIVHELGHAVGYHHEQTRPDRDEFVKINFQNIQSGQEYNFEKYNWKLINDQGVKYDYWSVMHYGGYAFSRGGVTIETLNKDFQDVIGTVPGLSFKDIQAANRMYKCDSKCTNQCPEKAVRSKECTCWCNNLNPTKPVVEWKEGQECKGGDDFTDACIDYNDDCEGRAKSGECDSNPNFMLKNCRKSCRICGKNPVCKDYHKNCPYWRVIGECKANPGWMSMNCRRACKICDSGTKEPADCEDTYSEVCKSAASGGDCERYAGSMLWECPVACKACGQNITCRNWNILCNTWESMGECKRNPRWMQRHCPKACGVCEGEDVPDCKNYQGDSNCKYWAGIGECSRNSGWMPYNCAKACRICGEKQACLNFNPNCRQWKGQGRCESDKVTMNFQCGLACGLCKGRQEDTDECENHDFNCEQWGSTGECDKNPGFMLPYCPRSCRVCGKDQVCKNFHPKCHEWAKMDECNKNPLYMRLHCRPACGMCTPNHTTTTMTTTAKAMMTSATITTLTTATKSTAKPMTTLEVWLSDIETNHNTLKVCNNLHPNCVKWAKLGECEDNPRYMRVNCRLACGLCTPDKPITTGKPMTTRSTTRRVCKNLHPNCVKWAKLGECEDNPSYMRVNCRLACGLCTPDKPATTTKPMTTRSTTRKLCKNLHPNCVEWAKMGECEINLRYMRVHCRLACGLCTPDKPITTTKPMTRLTTQEICKNLHPNCVEWAKIGECDKNPRYMKLNCRPACGLCTPVITTTTKSMTTSEGGVSRLTTRKVCKNLHENCDDWAKIGECDKNPGYMKINCRLACGLCTPDKTTTKTTTTVTTAKPTISSVETTTAESKGSTTKSWQEQCDEQLPRKCTDDVDFVKKCPVRAANGECEKNPSIMHRFCKKSCRMCGPDMVCKNYHKMCEEWAETGQCLSNPGYMFIFCRPACKCCVQKS